MFTVTPQLFLPWLTAVAAVVPLVILERWIHKHLQGVGLLVTNDPETAVILYYFVMLPGVIVHEFGHWVMATLLRVKIRKIRIWPERQRGGTIRLGLVQTDKVDPVRSTLIGLGPLAAGVAVVLLISTRVLNTGPFYAALATGDLPTIFAGVDGLTGTPDFWIWTYVLFAVSNAMMPSAADRQSWPAVGLGIALVVGAMFLMDLGNLVVLGLQQVALAAEAVTVAFLTAIGVDLVFVVVIFLLEEVLGRVVGRVIDYK